jgi:hypothetical protein
VRHRLQGHEWVTCHRLTLIDACDPWGKAHREVCGLDNRPAEIFRAVLGVALAVNLAMTAPLTLHAAAVGGQGPALGKRAIGPVSHRMVHARISPILGTVLSQCRSGLGRMWRTTPRSRHWIGESQQRRRRR